MDTPVEDDLAEAYHFADVLTLLPIEAYDETVEVQLQIMIKRLERHLQCTCDYCFDDTDNVHDDWRKFRTQYFT